ALYFPRKNLTAPDTRTFLLNRLGSRQSAKMENLLALILHEKIEPPQKLEHFYYRESGVGSRQKWKIY
ncbi:MAG: hypothetical protein F6K40_15390, partial [Okeania sp. SIO3I5]|uniref:hypothetical protein n=1 Tax=Okeania sp. SIO3I5 TaxID=2607805 RepID=UPI0013B94C14